MEDVPWLNLGNERSICDLCTSSLPNLHVSCGCCGWDVCVRCLAEHHREQQQQQQQQQQSLDAPTGSQASEPSTRPPQRKIPCLNPMCEFHLTPPGCESRPLGGEGGASSDRDRSWGLEAAEWPVVASQYFEAPRLSLLRAMLSQVRCSYQPEPQKPPPDPSGPQAQVDALLISPRMSVLAAAPFPPGSTPRDAREPGRRS